MDCGCRKCEVPMRCAVVKEKLKAEIKYDKDSKPHEIVMGGDPENPTWKEYLDQYKEEFQPHIEAIKEAILEAKLENTVASNICNDIYFVVGDVGVGFTWRAWGDLLQAIHNKREGYMMYYM